ncbi:STAS domain-containing protein [Blastococcus mobilis]|uniref:Stage II sporulation protein AA (Anti-sigma F factor antagonist) n=1 Tax=Blastococcus mobilis TaxID=1938746 RepID=A0A238V875_9ACTN|nr:STAS domain-containing protein [Blastococcus mobilis]SNR30418.1 stage II sporulation protein AA (anti-sigma F factor antagonist) [Blastococcus mobilis]
MKETNSREQAGIEPEVTHQVVGGTARLTVTGELTDLARRPLVRVVTDLLLTQPAPARIELALSAVTFMNSAGMAVLVQLQRLTAPRGIDLVLVDPPAAVVRPLQLSGLWHRFPLGGAVPEAYDPGGLSRRGGVDRGAVRGGS